MVIDIFTNFSLSSSTILTNFSFPFTYFLFGTTLIIAVLYFALRSNCVYLVDFICYLPADHLRVPGSMFLEHVAESGCFEKESFHFQEKVLERSGVGDEACLPVSVHELPELASSKAAKEEIEEVLFTVVSDLLAKHGINPKSIDILISNCSIFCPPPSVTYSEQFRFAWSVIRQKLSDNVKQNEIYVPKLKKAINHFCIHAGGRAIIDGVESNIKMEKLRG